MNNSKVFYRGNCVIRGAIYWKEEHQRRNKSPRGMVWFKMLIWNSREATRSAAECIILGFRGKAQAGAVTWESLTYRWYLQP
jgi:hypothetical protein